ncbi:MAG TPA: Lrp/AsnC family transcriptional regulator [Methanolinea sp.]|nr:Lrp/AsnC family transcriptional regulator [Methanolinea sp.]HQK55102.1 Lrp/AsnC family transcriptional regulator [Methanolinea sp.]
MTKDVFFPDETDIAILDALQDEVPLVCRPWDVLAEKVGITSGEFLIRIEQLRDAGILKGVSPILESRRWGLPSATLVALKVPPGRVEEVAALVSSYTEVSHNFRRDHPFPLWFTLSGRDEEHVQALLADILERAGLSEEDALNLPTEKKIKVDVRFRFRARMQGEGAGGPA